MVRGDYHSNIIEGGGPITTGYTSNVLIRRACLGELRFDPALGRAGGEDTMFFYALHLKGALFAAEPDARVFEEVPPSRQSLGWILRRRYRAGQTHAHLTAQFHPRRAPFVAALAMLKVLYCALATLLCVPFPTAHMRNLARGALHVGVVAYSFGGRFHQEYGHGRPDASPLAGERPRG
jgi:succinoglycan biosynthesis protein ExoM